MRRTTWSIDASLCWCASITLALASAGGVLLYAIDAADQATTVQRAGPAPGVVPPPYEAPTTALLNTFTSHHPATRGKATEWQHDRAPQHAVAADQAVSQASMPRHTTALSQPRDYATHAKWSIRPGESKQINTLSRTQTRQANPEKARRSARGKVIAVGAAPTTKRAPANRPTPETDPASIEQTRGPNPVPSTTEPTAPKTEHSDDIVRVPIDLASQASVAATAADGSDRPAGPEEQGFDPARIIGWVNIGYTSTDPADHLIGRGIKRRGWTHMIERDIVPQLDWGTRRILVHNPFGARSVYTVMQFDQYIEAQDAELDWATQGFSAAWKRVVDGAYTDGEPVEVIGYLGSIVNDKEMDALVKAGDLAAWNRRAEASVAPLLKAGMSVGFDQGSLIPEDHPAYAFLRSLQARGVKVYSETYPKADMPHLHDIPVIMVERYVKIVREKRHLFPPKQALGHTVSRLINGHEKDPDDPDWAFNHAVQVLADGDALITDLNQLIERGQTRRQVLERVERLSGAAYD